SAYLRSIFVHWVSQEAVSGQPPWDWWLEGLWPRMRGIVRTAEISSKYESWTTIYAYVLNIPVEGPRSAQPVRKPVSAESGELAGPTGRPESGPASCSRFYPGCPKKSSTS